MPKKKIPSEEMLNKFINLDGVAEFSNQEAAILIENKFTRADVCLHIFLKMVNPQRNLPNLSEIESCIGVSKAQIRRSAKKLEEHNLLPDWFSIRNHSSNENIEANLRDRLVINHFPTALRELSCPAGRIDILTDTQIIEVKNIADWKSALGQILVYSAYYPEHKKRIHLFGSDADKERLLNIELSCSAFDVLVTFEVIGGGE